MKFNIDEITNFEVELSAIYYKDNLVEEKLEMENFSLDNKHYAMSKMDRKVNACKFVFQNKKPMVPFLLRIYLIKDGKRSSPYNIYPGQLKNGENYFWNNLGGFHIGDKLVSLYMLHNYIKSYDFPNSDIDTTIYLTEYMFD
jgi:hypothetical protein